MSLEHKYLKYKSKYLALKQQFGGGDPVKPLTIHEQAIINKNMVLAAVRQNGLALKYAPVFWSYIIV
jgi:hypothetical protein